MTTTSKVNYESIVKIGFEVMFEKVAMAADLETGDLSPDQEWRLENLKTRTIKLLEEYCTQNDGV